MLKLISLTKSKHFGTFLVCWCLTIGGVIETHHVNAITLPHLLQEQKHFSGVKASQGSAPITKGFANRLAYSGGVVMINGTAVITLCHKQSTTAYNTTEAELDAGTTLCKHVLWLRIYMEDISLPYHTPINVRHIATRHMLSRNMFAMVESLSPCVICSQLCRPLHQSFTICYS